MKKIYSIAFAAVALFSAASCQEELVNNETPSAQGENFTITAVADAQTKTALTDEGLNSVWTPGDAIAVIDYDGQGAEFTTAITENIASAKFTCEDFNVGDLTDISALPIVALYPYQEGLTCSIQSQLNPNGDNTIRGIVFPHEQTAVAGSFDKTAAFTWAMATGATKDNLVFNNLYSLLKVKVAEENITEIKISATTGSLAGNVTLPMTQSGATLTVVDGEGKSEVTLTCEDGFDTEKYYYICVLPGTYEGFSIALNGYTVKTKASAATFAAATVYDLGVFASPKYLYVKNDMGWTTVNIYGWEKADDNNKVAGAWPGTEMSVTEDINGISFLKFEIPENYVGKEIGLIFNNGSKQLSDYFTTLTSTTHLRLTPGTPIVVDPQDKSSFKYRIYVYDQGTKKDVNIYYWGDGFTASSWPGVKITNYVEYDNKSLGYFEIPVEAYSGNTFNYLLNVNGDELKTGDLSVINPTSDLCVGYYNNSGGKGFWMDNTKPYTVVDNCN